MPRKPTGNPRGRPKGTGELDAPQRITVWLAGTQYRQLEAYAEGRHFHRGTPVLASCVRELLADALARSHKQQTGNVPRRPKKKKRLENIPPPSEDNLSQTGNVPSTREDILAQIAAWREDDRSFDAIAKELNAAGIPTFSGKGMWNKGTVQKQFAKLVP